jgi:TfoX/Sxy family transcriptional regulator of competence genes
VSLAPVRSCRPDARDSLARGGLVRLPELVMAYDEGLAQRIREILDERGDVAEKRMFGGLAFLLGGNMCVGVVGDDLMVRVGPGAYEEALRQPHARKMDFTGRPMKGLLFVAADGLLEDADLRLWVERGVRFAGALPPK